MDELDQLLADDSDQRVNVLRTDSTSTPVRGRLKPATPPPTPIVQRGTEQVYERIAQERAQLNAQLDAMAQPPDYSAQIAEAGRRKGQAGNALTMALAAQYAGRSATGLAPQFLKQSAALQAPQQVEGGQVDSEGNVVIDPAFKRLQQTGMAMRRLQGLDTAEQAARTEEDKRQARADELAGRNTRAQQHDALLKAIAAGGNHNMVQVEDPATGKMFWADPRTGQATKPVTGPGGAEIVKPEKFPASVQKELTDLVQQRTSVDTALKAAKAAPNAFGRIKGAADLVPGVAGQVAMSERDKLLSPEELDARSQVYNNVSSIIRNRAGTAQSKQEIARLNMFLPAPTDSASQIETKLNAFRKWVDDQHIAVSASATHRSPSAAPATPSGAPPLASPAPAATAVAPAPAGAPPGQERWSAEKRARFKAYMQKNPDAGAAQW